MEEQTEQDQTWWQKNKKLLMRTALIALLAVVIVLIILIVLGYILNWDWTGLTATDFKSQKTTNIIVYQPGKTLWDWLGLLGVLAIPVVVGLFTFQQGRASDKSRQQQKQTELEIATDYQREQALQAYIDKISEMLLDKNHPLRDSAPEDEVRKIARVRTLTILPRLNKERKRSVIQFLYESVLIDKDRHFVDLKGADLSGADLRGVKLRGANLEETQLQGADLGRADLSEAFLVGADLNKANLSVANLSEAILIGANLSEALQLHL